MSSRCSQRIRAPAATARGRYVRGHALASALGGVRPVGVGHPAGDLVVLPAQSIGTAAQDVARRRVLARNLLHAERRLDLFTDREQVVGGEVLDPILRPPRVERRFGRTPVEPAVHLGATAGTAALGIGDRRQPERHGDPARSVLPIHLLERERHDAALLDPGAFFDDQDVVACLCEHSGGGGPTGTRTDDQHVTIVMHAHARATFGISPVDIGVRPGLPDVRIAERPHQAWVLGNQRQRERKHDVTGPAVADDHTEDVDERSDDEHAEPGDRRQHAHAPPDEVDRTTTAILGQPREVGREESVGESRDGPRGARGVGHDRRSLPIEAPPTMPPGRRRTSTRVGIRFRCRRGGVDARSRRR